MKERDFCLKTMALVRKCVNLELSEMRKSYKSGYFDNATARCDNIIGDVKRLKKMIAAEKRDRLRKGQRVHVSLKATVVDDLVIRVPDGADAQGFISNYIRRKNIHAMRKGVYTDESASIQDGEETKVFYPYAR